MRGNKKLGMRGRVPSSFFSFLFFFFLQGCPKVPFWKTRFSAPLKKLPGPRAARRRYFKPLFLITVRHPWRRRGPAAAGLRDLVDRGGMPKKINIAVQNQKIAAGALAHMIETYFIYLFPTETIEKSFFKNKKNKKYKVPVGNK